MEGARRHGGATERKGAHVADYDETEAQAEAAYRVIGDENVAEALAVIAGMSDERLDDNAETATQERQNLVDYVAELEEQLDQARRALRATMVREDWYLNEQEDRNLATSLPRLSINGEDVGRYVNSRRISGTLIGVQYVTDADPDGLATHVGDWITYQRRHEYDAQGFVKRVHVTVLDPRD